MVSRDITEGRGSATVGSGGAGIDNSITGTSKSYAGEDAGSGDNTGTGGSGSSGRFSNYSLS